MEWSVNGMVLRSPFCFRNSDITENSHILIIFMVVQYCDSMVDSSVHNLINNHRYFGLI